MSEPVYDIFITGALKDGVDSAGAAANLERLFKISEQKAAALVDGRPHCLKKNLDREAARRFMAALQRAGFETAGKKREPAASQPAAEPGKTTGPRFTLAPAGSPVLREEERAKIPELDIDTSRLKLASVFSEPETSQHGTPKIEAPDFGLAPPGSDLEELPRYEHSLDPDISHLSLSEPGEDLVPPRRERPPPPPSTDHLTLVDE